MVIYHINKGIGMASSGVEYAQKYRNEMLQTLGQKQKFIFVDFIMPNIIDYTQNLEFKTEDIVWAPGFMAGQTLRPSSYKLAEFEKTLQTAYEKEETKAYILYTLVGKKTTLKAWKGAQDSINRVDVLRDNKLWTVTCYSDRKTSTTYYSEGTLQMRVFYKENGQVAYEQYYEKNDITVTRIDNQLLYGRNAFLQLFFEKMTFTKKDLIIIDRSLDVADALLPQGQNTKKAVVIHAEHYNSVRSTADWIAWNNFYEYVFTNEHLIDQFIVATKQQAETLANHFKIMGKDTEKITIIPVGNLPSEEIGYDDTTVNRFHLMTASRLASEKNVDLIIQAIVQAKKNISELSLSIYGTGQKLTDLKKLVKKLDAESYITFEGHQELKTIYQKHGAYLSASSSEGFGLTLLEAIGSGLPLIGFKVPYGNMEFIDHKKNGILVPKKNTKADCVALSEAIERLFRAPFDYDLAREISLEKARGYSNDIVRDKWQSLIIKLTE